MTPEIDWTKIIAQVFVDLTKAAVKETSAKVAEALTALLQALQKDFEPYLVATLKKCSSVRTLLHRDEPIPLEKIYVKTYLKSAKQKLDDKSFVEKLGGYQAALVLGTAGSGKSIFMKHLFVTLVKERHGKIPIFIELRQMNSLDARDLLTFIFHSIVGPGAKVTQAQFESALKAGLFALVFDGFDEIDFDWRADLEKQIFKLQEQYPKNWMLISSRPDNRFAGWHSFKVFQVQPMAKKEVLTLVRKIDYEKDVKKKFLRALNSGMYEKHASFLSTPLLAIMMLLTFDQFATIPDKIHVFYDQAFDALFSKHDASKQGGYTRRTRTSLSIDDFKRCLSAFCAASYGKGKTTFSDSEARAFLQQAFAFEKITVDTANFIHDLIESVCILQRDGLFLTFSHRSFQEYFAAYFVCRSPSVDFAGVLDQLAKKLPDSVLRMAFDMNQNLIEREWVLPKLIALNEKIALVPSENMYQYLTMFYTRPRIVWTTEITIFVGQFSDWGIFRLALYRFYTAQFEASERRRGRTNKEAFLSMLSKVRADPESEDEFDKSGFTLSERDDQSLKESWISSHIAEERKLLVRLQAQVNASISEQNSILSSMFDQIKIDD